MYYILALSSKRTYHDCGLGTYECVVLTSTSRQAGEGGDGGDVWGRGGGGGRGGHAHLNGAIGGYKLILEVR